MILSLTPMPEELIKMVENKTGEKIIIHNLNNDYNKAIKALEYAEIVIAWNANVKKGMFDNCKNLKWLFSLSVGTEKIPFEEFNEKRIILTSARGLLGSHMAEHAIGVMIAFSRQFKRCFKNQQKKYWEFNMPVDELYGKTLCVIGAGSIGKEIAKKAKTFDMRVIGLKKNLSSVDGFDEIYGMEKLSYALGHADYTVLIVPLTDETYHMVGLKEFKLMKKDSIFINISRGDTVNEEEMIEALRQGYIAGAGLDVFHEEPLPKESPLWDMDNVLITPHSAGDSPLLMKKIMDLFTENLILYRQGKPLINVVDLQKKY